MKIEWIPVSERLPEKSGNVLVWSDSHIPDKKVGGAYFVRYSKRHNAFNANDFADDAPHAFKDVVFWAEVPEPPDGWSDIV